MKTDRRSIPPTFAPRLIRRDRQTASAALAAGAGTIELPALPMDLIGDIEMVAVSGPGMGGARVSLYRNEVIPENFMGSGLLAATDPGVTFVDARPWLYGNEQLLVVVSGAAGTRATATVWLHLYLSEFAAPAPSVGQPAEPVEVAEGGGSDL